MTAAVKLWRRDTTGTGEMILTKDWHSEFMAAMEAADGNIPRACQLACIGEGLVFARMDETSRHYDPEFAEQVKLLEGPRLARMRENLYTMAEQPTRDGASVAIRLLGSALPGIHGAKQQKVKVEVEAEVIHRLAPEVVAASAARTRVMLSRRKQDALPSPQPTVDEVVDAELVEVE